MADAIAQYKAARSLNVQHGNADIDHHILGGLVSANVIADAIAAQTAAVQANTAAVADLAQQIYEDGMYDGDDEEVDENWEVDNERDDRLRGLGDT